MNAVDDYFAGLDPAPAAAFRQIARALLAEVPDAEPGTSYGMAAYRYLGKPLLGFRQAKQHLSVFPFSPAAVESVRDQLAADAVSKGTVRFTSGDPLPESVVRELVRFRAAEIRGG